MATPTSRSLPLYSGHNHVKNWTFNLGFAATYTTASPAPPRRSLGWGSPTISSRPIRCCEFPMRAPWKRRSMRIWSSQALAAMILWSTPSDDHTRLRLRHDTPLSPGHRNEFHAGLQQAFGRYFVVDGEYIWKYTHKALRLQRARQHADHFSHRVGEIENSRLCHPRQRAELPWLDRVRRLVQRGGAFLRPAGQRHWQRLRREAAVFRIDHDENFNQTTHLQYQPWKNAALVQLQLALRQRPGGRSGPVRGRQLQQRPEWHRHHCGCFRPDSDQQFEAGLYCGSVHATPTTPISPSSLCPASQYGSTLMKIPAAGHRGRRPQSAPHRIPQSLRYCRWARQHFPGRQV